MERIFDFDHVPDRRGTDSYKWEDADSVLPLWVADMDFPTAPVIQEALKRRVEHGIFGYVKVPEAYYYSIIRWFSTRHNWNIDRDQIIYTSGVVPAISAIIKALCRPGDGVILQTPAYNCFFSSIRNNECVVVENPLLRRETPTGFSYDIDFDDLEMKASDPENTLMLLCNPHNPTGRIWTQEELLRIFRITTRHGVRVVSDEIHNELTRPGLSYIPYGTIDDHAVVCCSPSKAFNIAGLQIANIISPVEEERSKIDRAININEVCDVNPFGVTALQSAYNEGAPWLDALREYISGNYLMLKDFFRTELPEIKVADLEATYLAWIDISSLGISSEDLEKHLEKDAGVRINAGTMYGLDGYIRINMACPRHMLKEGLDRIKKGIGKLKGNY